MTAHHGIVGMPARRHPRHASARPPASATGSRSSRRSRTVKRSSFAVRHRLIRGELLCVEGEETRVWAGRDPDDPARLKGSGDPGRRRRAASAPAVRRLTRPRERRRRPARRRRRRSSSAPRPVSAEGGLSSASCSASRAAGGEQLLAGRRQDAARGSAGRARPRRARRGRARRGRRAAARGSRAGCRAPAPTSDCFRPGLWATTVRTPSCDRPDVDVREPREKLRNAATCARRRR